MPIPPCRRNCARAAGATGGGGGIAVPFQLVFGTLELGDMKMGPGGLPSVQRAGRAAPAHLAGVARLWASFILKSSSSAAGASAEQKHGTFRHCPLPAVCLVANYDAKGPYAGNPCGH